MAIPSYNLWWGRGPGNLVQFAVYTVLIDHEEGIFLFDTGFDLAFMEKHTPQDNAKKTADQTVLAQLAKLGIRPEAVTHVINSHLHLDHVGGNKFFPGATFVVHEKEYAAARNPQPFEYQSYSELSFDPELHRLSVTGDRDILKLAGTPGEEPANKNPIKYQFVKGDTEFAKGVWLFETPGHSAGQMSMMIELEGRKPMLFASDAAHTSRHLDEMIVPGFHVDPVQGYKSLVRLKAIRDEHDAEIFHPHPLGDSLTYRNAPAWFE
jgi:4-pyridoxolactonase